MVLISHIYKFIYLKNYKVAGSSIEALLGQYCIDPQLKSSYSFNDTREMEVSSYGVLGSRFGLDGDRTIVKATKDEWFNHMNASDLKTKTGDTMFDEYIKICGVRNPYDVMVSSYFWDIYLGFISKDVDFKTYCMKKFQKNYNRNNKSRILLNGKEVCQYYIRYEHLEEDLIMVFNKLGITNYDLDELPYHKSGIRPTDKPYQEYYDDETRNFVYKLFKDEIELFHYTF